MAGRFDYLKKLLPLMEKQVPEVTQQRGVIALPEQALVPEVIGEGTSRAKLSSLPIEEADTLSPKLSGAGLPLNEQQAKLEKYKQGLAALGLGGAGATALALNLDTPIDQLAATTPPKVPEPTRAPAFEPPMVPAAMEEPKSETQSALEKMQAMLSRPSSAEVAPAPVKDIDFGEQQSIASMEGYKDAQARSRDAVLASNLGRIGAAFATGASGIKNNFDEVNAANVKAAEGIPDQYLKQVAFEKEDPNSPMSQGYRQLASAMGFNIKGAASAADLEKLIPQLSNIYNQQEAQRARKEMAKESREARMQEVALRLAMMKDEKKVKSDIRTEDKKNKFIENSQKVLSKEFEKLQKIENAFDSIETSSKDKMGAADVSILYNFIKSQDPESVVREGEIALGQRGMSLGSRIRTATLGQFTGELMDDKFRKDIVKIARRLKDQGGSSYDQAANTIRDTARQRYGFTDDELTLIDPVMNRKKKQEQKASSLPPVSQQTTQLIQSRSDEENLKRLEELKAKYGR